MKNMFLFIVVVFLAMMSHGFNNDDVSALQRIFLAHRHFGGPLPSDDLRHYAEVKGLSDNEMSAMLLEFVRNGMENNADNRQQRMGLSALCGLAKFGGVAERAVVLDIIRTATDQNWRSFAIQTCIRMMPDKWEEVVREVATGERYGNYDRFIAYEEAFRVGEHSDARTKERVEKVLSEFMERETTSGNSISMQRWVDELKAR